MKKLFLLLSMLTLSTGAFAGNYENFRVAVYVMVQDVNRMADTDALKATWAEFSKNLKVDKVYLETFRDMTFVDEAALQNAMRFFESKGVETMGGITYNFSGGTRMRWETVCYSNPEHRAIVKRVAELTAKYFDEFVLDDYYFTNCKCDLCIAAKGDASWSEFRTKLLDDAAKELIVGPAKAVNPDAKVIVKYPNWYEHFQGLGFDLEHGPHTFDGVYTGTETRDPAGEQHLQPYESFAIYKYFDNLRPGHNRGGWVDTGSMTYLDMFPEQLWMTLLAKSPEITLFNYGSMRSPMRQTTNLQLLSFMEQMAQGNSQSSRFQLAMHVASNLYQNGVQPYKYEEKQAVSSLDAAPTLEVRGKQVILKINLDGAVNTLQTTPVDTELLGKTYYSNGYYENPDGTPLAIDRDFAGNARSLSAPKVGPFENARPGQNEFVVWTLK